MVIYGILGIVWLMVLEGIIKQDENKVQAFFVRLGNFLLWPLMVVIFIYHFIKELNNNK